MHTDTDTHTTHANIHAHVHIQHTHTTAHREGIQRTNAGVLRADLNDTVEGECRKAESSRADCSDGLVRPTA